MTNIPKKLNNNEGVKLSSTLSGQRELIREMRNKINKLIDYLKASKGECACKSYETVEIGCEVCHPELKQDPPEHEIDPETLCSKCGNWKGCHPIKECKTFVTPEHEESCLSIKKRGQLKQYIKHAISMLEGYDPNSDTDSDYGGRWKISVALGSLRKAHREISKIKSLGLGD